ncbi:hypothetical protein GCM10023310_03370 [Paenibacillus vulneris]|uniref:GNAT family N-acetyltransferase n=1 Tax=Paenibacillus vulneris TaxID=1133364 RepID=A0ABW3UM39_9BACL
MKTPREKISFRLHTPSDTHAIVSLISREPYHFMYGVTAEEFERDLDEPGERIREHTFVVEAGADMAAYFSLCFVKRNSHTAVYCYGTVDPDWRRQGIGTAIFDFIFSKLEKIALEESTPIHFIHRAITRIPGETALGIRFRMQEQQSLEVLRWKAVEDLRHRAPSKEWLFRAPTLADAQAWAEIYNDAFGGNKSTASVVHEFEGTGFSPELYLLCTTLSGEPLGFVSATLRGTQGRIPTIAVRHEHQKRGIGKAMLSLILQRLTVQGAEDVRLSVDTANAAARSLYSKFGFQQDYRRIHYATKFLP